MTGTPLLSTHCIAYPYSQQVNEFIYPLKQYEAEQFGDRAWQSGKPIVLVLQDEAENTYGGLLASVVLTAVHVDGFFIEKPYRGLGYGKKLMQLLEQEALKRHCHLVLLETTDRHNLSFYLKYGFKKAGVIKNFADNCNFYYLKKHIK